LKQIPQRRFVKGVVAATPDFEQPANSIPRASNLVYSRRGGLLTTDGSLILAAWVSTGGVLQPSAPGSFLGLVALESIAPTGLTPFYLVLLKVMSVEAIPLTQGGIGPITNLAASAGAAGALTGTYKYKVTATDGAGGETTLSNEATVTLSAQKGSLTWTAITYATGYNIYRTAAGGAAGSEEFLASVTTNSYTDNNADSVLNATIPLPVANTTQVMNLYKISSSGGFTYVATFPADVLPILPHPPTGRFPQTGGGTGGGGGATTGGTQNPKAVPSGGLSGNTSAIPQIIQFLDKAIILLGNGYAPQAYDPVGGTVAALSNTYTPVYPTWQANVAYVQGDYIVPSSSNGHYYKCLQPGTSGASQPTFPTTTQASVTDGSIIWKESGLTTATNPPVGGGYGIVHFASLWIANTSPTNTADDLDGPSALRMSDINNQNSWNPVNAAFVDKDNGQQCMGIASFTIGEFGIAPQGSLVVFKNFNTYQVLGTFGSSNFSLQRAQTDMGCMAPRTIAFVPGFGIFRLTHLGIAVFDGVKDRLMSDDIRPYLFDSAAQSLSDILPMDWNYAWASQATLTADPPMYVMAIPTKIAQLTGVTLAAASFTSPVINPGTYYVYVTKKIGNTGYEYQVSVEATVVIAANQCIAVTLPALEPTDAGGSANTYWSIFIGPSSNGENMGAVVSEADVAAGRWSGGTPRVVNVGGQAGAEPLQASLGSLNRLLCFDLVTKGWTIIDLPFAISSIHQVRYAGAYPLTLAGGAYDGTLRRLFSGDTTWDGQAITWSFRTAEVFSQSSLTRVQFVRVVLRGVGSGSASITCKATVSGNDGQTITTLSYADAMGNGQFELRFPIALTGLNAHATFSGTGQVEIQEVEWEVQPRAVGVPVAI
jgi:hypothetical protein